MTLKEFAKKIIASINPGTADISGIGDGTIKGAISELNKKITCNILQSWSYDEIVAGTEKECNYSDYLLLIISLRHYNNVRETIIVTSEYFAKKTSSSKAYITADNKTIGLYPSSSNMVHAYGDTISANFNIEITGIIKI